MKYKIAIHQYLDVFTKRWVDYLTINNIEFNFVDCYSNNIIKDMKEYDILLWSWNLSEFESLNFAKELIYSLEKMNKIVFPDFKTSFFYDNKIGQKYLLESIDAPFIKTYVFYKKKEAINWIEMTSFPKVFKLSGGAGALNVKLCKSKKEALKFTNIAFGKGFSQFDRVAWFKDKLSKFKSSPSKLTTFNLLKSFARLFVKTKKENLMSEEKGYIYFQEFIPNNTFDIRVVVINSKAFAFKRLCRDNDFRASGSGNILYEKSEIDERCIQIAFNTSKKLEVQSMAYDFVFDKNNEPLIVEISYHFASKASDNCVGYWDDTLNWHETNINPQDMIIESLLEKLN
jgi:glutathione synthase/RimK-type ligase-like ATP-grasp enzyme